MSFLKGYIKKNFSNFTYFYSILRSRMLVVIFLSLVVGILDSLGLTLFLPLLQMADGSSDQVDLGNLSFVIDGMSYLGIQLSVGKVLLFLALVFILKGIVVYQSSIYKLKAQQALTKKVRMSIVDKFPTFQYQQFVKTDIGKIQNIFLGEIGRLSSTFNNYISMVQGGVMIVVYMLFSFVVDWKFALLVCAGGLVSNLIFNKINKLTKEKSKNISIVGNQFSNVLSQYIFNFKYLKASGKIMDYRKTVEVAIDRVQLEFFNMGALQSKVSAFREPLLILIVVSVIFFQVTIFDSSIATIMVSLLFFYRALTSIVQVQNNYNNTLANQGAIDNIISFNKELGQHSETVGNSKFTTFNHSIDLTNIQFRYEDRIVLDGVSLSIPKNSMMAFVGESGSGKTTLVNIIIKLLQPQTGHIAIDGVNLNNYNQFSYQEQIGYISQEPTIFNDTIYNNITFWAPKNPENMERFRDAIRRASIEDFIASLNAQEDSLLGTNGVNLSGGQRQRISIARELYRNVQLLILDEATSALDSETERDIQESIDELKGSVTVLCIAHRLSTVKNMDIICLLEAGKIVSKGSFSELINQSERFKQMVQLQELQVYDSSN